MTSGPVLIHLLYSTWDGVKGMTRNFIRQEVREEHNFVSLVSSFFRYYNSLSFTYTVISSQSKRDWE